MLKYVVQCNNCNYKRWTVKLTLITTDDNSQMVDMTTLTEQNVTILLAVDLKESYFGITICLILDRHVFCNSNAWSLRSFKYKNVWIHAHVQKYRYTTVDCSITYMY